MQRLLVLLCILLFVNHNGSAQTIFDLRIPELRMQVVAADGLAVEPVTVDELRMGAGETYDVIITPQDEAYNVFAQTIDRRGFTVASLSVRPDIHAPIPAIDPPHWLDMADMMGSMQPPAQPVRHAHTEYGSSVDMRVDTPRSNLDDAGVHLRHHQRLYGRRVLTYADLHTLDADDQREPSRELELHLTGNMHRYQWGFDGLSFEQSKPIQVRTGERVRVRLVNDTMMLHPMHLHGMWSELEDESGAFLARKHTVVVQPAQSVSYRVSADAVGRWAYHCHLLYHMMAGMMTKVVVATLDAGAVPAPKAAPSRSGREPVAAKTHDPAIAAPDPMVARRRHRNTALLRPVPVAARIRANRAGDGRLRQLLQRDHAAVRGADGHQAAFREGAAGADPRRRRRPQPRVHADCLRRHLY